MIMYYQDPEILRWGLDILNVEPFSDSSYCGSNTQNDPLVYGVGYTGEGNFGADSIFVENDEIIAHSLQEEFSQVAVAEATSPSNEGEEHTQESVLTQDWFIPTMRDFYSVNEDIQEVVDDVESLSSCSTPGEVLYDWEELEPYDDSFTLDGEVGNKFNQMVPVPHVPRINGEIPSFDEATSDHQRLLDRLQLYNLVERKVQGDGNCQFRALSDQFYRTPEHHKFVRQQVITQLKSHPENYEAYVPMAYTDYLKKLSTSGEWGDHVTLQAAADSYGVKMFVITSFKDTCYIEILPSDQRSKRVIFLSFWAEVHYNSIYPEGDMPTSESKKKSWWRFGNKN
ncbi:uncharacterized protein A4U43_C01F6950 [Asparagus officinalis]|uniref:ubiquitinyl hydrolase 1 n=1 Tax=Asparagus officinalis TaxID=4686 RepID=A0A5P1FMG2_ASPOF|nr:uncharacterized protein LOC109850456 [Asparagus officinalis]XP_020276073.1 uncharacterized protein LOC109850456 [Asparagus officinalis]ONK79496.1 uncharacterized protein A4U43_C01F6950 [Asparagus officinalis]